MSTPLPTSYYALKGMIAEMTPEQQQEINEVREAVKVLALRSDVSVLGLALAGFEIDAME